MHTEGYHMVFTKPGVIRPVVIPRYNAVPVFIIKNNFALPASPATAISNCSAHNISLFLPP